MARTTAAEKPQKNTILGSPQTQYRFTVKDPCAVHPGRWDLVMELISGCILITIKRASIPSTKRIQPWPNYSRTLLMSEFDSGW